MKNYFAQCNTLDDAKNLFRKLCFDLHPDHNKSATAHKDFIEMMKQFKAFKPSAKYARESDENFNADKFYNIVKQFENLQDVLVSFVGIFIWLEDEPHAEGATKRQKEDIKKIKLEGYNPPRWARKRAKWYYSPEGYKQFKRCNKTFDELKRTWGSKTYKPNQTKEGEQTRLKIA